MPDITWKRVTIADGAFQRHVVPRTLHPIEIAFLVCSRFGSTRATVYARDSNIRRRRWQRGGEGQAW